MPSLSGSRAISCAVVIGFALISTPGALSAPLTAKVDEIPTQLRAALGELRVSKTPVYLPTWLPPRCKGPLGVGSGPLKNGYELWLGTASADTTFFTSAGTVAPKRTKRSVKLANGSVAYIQDLKDFCMDFSMGGHTYRIGLPSYGTKKDVAMMVQIANSMKLVPVAVMRALPAKEDRLAAAYKSEQESAESSRRSDIGQLYGASLDATARGEYPKAKSQLEQVIKSWADCPEMPPMVEVQLALAQVLKKMNQKEQAAAIEKQFAAAAAEREATLKAEVAELKEQTDLKLKAGEDHRPSKTALSAGRHKLADFYVAAGKYDDAEAAYKTAYSDVVTIYGDQYYDARTIKDSLARLGRIKARN